MLTFDIHGDPFPDSRPRWSRKSGFMHRDRKADGWKHAVRAAGLLAMLQADRKPFDSNVPIGVDIVFRFRRPVKHWQKGQDGGQLRAGAPIFHLATPDKDNLEKAVLDALGRFDGLPNLIWQDDRQVAVGRTMKLFVDVGQKPGATVSIFPLLAEMQIPKPTSLILSLAEAWQIDRRRSGLTVQQMAAFLGMPQGRYREWEKGARDAPPKHMPKITAGEWCFVLRLRHGISTGDVSALCGLGVKWVNSAERDAVDPTALVEWWLRYLRDLQAAEERAELSPHIPARMPPRPGP